MSNNANDPLGDEIMGVKRRINVSLPPRPELPDERVEQGARQLGEKYNSATQLRPAELAPPPPPSAPLVSSRFDFPAYLDEELAVRAASTKGPSGGKITKTYLVMLALQQAGYRVDEVDLIEDRRREKRLKR
jgi:hypothetical protein